jgi:hypothetical protein
MKNPIPINPKIPVERELMMRIRFIVMASISDRSGLAIAVIPTRDRQHQNLALFILIKGFCSEVVCQVEQ